jgi:hypothetical protein
MGSVSVTYPVCRDFPVMKWRTRIQGSRVRTPTLLQMESVECGSTALGIILGYYGRVVPLAELRRQCGVSRHGVNAYEMCRAARHYALEAKGLKVSLESSPSCPVRSSSIGNFTTSWSMRVSAVFCQSGAESRCRGIGLLSRDSWKQR